MKKQTSTNKYWLQVLVALYATMFAGLSLADADEAEVSLPAPHAVVAEVTASVMMVVRENTALLESDAEAYYGAVGDTLKPVVAFDYIARNVMGSHAAKATDEQRASFGEVFQGQMIQTYAKGLALYAENEIRVLPPEQPLAGRRRVSVKQLVVAAEGDHLLVYTMGQSKSTGEWKLLNVILDGINLGSTFHSQFSQAMKKEGDIDKVIAGWSENS